MRYAAAVQILLADQWLADRAIDGRGFARVARPLLDKPADQARATLATLGSDLAALIGVEQRQAAAELPGVAGPEDAAAPTAAALELVFTRICGLPGVVPELAASEQDPAAEGELGEGRSRCTALGPREALAQLGRAVGQAIYLIDALADLDEDLRRGDFNPCLVQDFGGGAQVERRRVRRAEAMLGEARARIEACLVALPLRRHRRVLHNILVAALGGRAELALASAAQVCERGKTPALALGLDGLRSLGVGVGRFAQATVALVFALVTSTWARVVQAATETGGSESGTDTETGETGETGGEALSDLPSQQPPDLPDGTGGEIGDAPESVSGPDNCVGNCIGDCIQNLCGGIGDACSNCGGEVCGGCVEDMAGLCTGCGDACSGCGQCGDACSGCGDACSACGDCGDACGQCGSGCGDCGNACSGCGDCGNACSGCGNCGNGCNC